MFECRNVVYIIYIKKIGKIKNKYRYNIKKINISYYIIMYEKKK